MRQCAGLALVSQSGPEAIRAGDPVEMGSGTGRPHIARPLGTGQCARGFEPMSLIQVNRPPPLDPEAALRRRAFVWRWVVLVVVLLAGAGVAALLGLRNAGVQIFFAAICAAVIVEELVVWTGSRRNRSRGQRGDTGG